MSTKAYDQRNPMGTRACKGCGKAFPARKTSLLEYCYPCRDKHNKGAKQRSDEQNAMTPGEAYRYLEAMCDQETAPHWIREEHLFGYGEKRCVKCGCTEAAADNTICARKV